MKSMILFALVTLCVVATSIAQKKLDQVNIESVLNNDRVLSNYIKCLLEEGPCTKEGRDLKKNLPDAIRTDCASCTDVQKRNSRKVITFLRMRKLADWKKLTDKYDPEGLFNKRQKQQQQQQRK